MNKKERKLVAAILFGIVIMVTPDLIEDSREVAHWAHLLWEILTTLSALFGVFYLMRDSFKTKHLLADEKQKSKQLQQESEKWREQSKKYVDGLSLEIDLQLQLWGLTNSEKEVAFLLLKGMSLKEVAEIRGTAEKTARAQSMSIYSKAGLSGRSELAAFFLEDLLLPTQKT